MIDVQTHYVGPEAARMLAGLTVHGIATPIAPTSPILRLDARLRAMDEAGVDVSVLSFAPAGVIADRAARAALCRAANDGLAAACALHPRRFVMAACLPLPDAEGALGELERIAVGPALRAVQIVAQTTGYRPDIGFDTVFARAADLRLPIILHPAAGVADIAPQFDDYGLSSGLHAMISSALVAARMIQSGMLDRIPALELVLTHLGGGLPFLIDRLDSRHTGPARHPPSHYLTTRVWLDCCGYPAGPALRCALDTVGAGRLLVGSDWPSRAIAPALDAIRGLALPHADEAAILGVNARRWFAPGARQ